jgi:hypothetical protein
MLSLPLGYRLDSTPGAGEIQLSSSAGGKYEAQMIEMPSPAKTCVLSIRGMPGTRPGFPSAFYVISFVSLWLCVITALDRSYEEDGGRSPPYRCRPIIVPSASGLQPTASGLFPAGPAVYNSPDEFRFFRAHSGSVGTHIGENPE